MNTLIASILLLVIAALAFVLWKVHAQLQTTKAKFSGIINTTTELERLETERQRFTEESEAKRKAITQQYDDAFARYGLLKTEVSSLEENQNDLSVGLYKAHFAFDTPDEYKSALETIRDKERQLIKAEQAVVCPIVWTVGNSKREGERMVRLHSKLFLRAFNGECDAAISNVSWNNIEKMQERIRKSFEVINKTGDVEKISITHPYYELKLDEIRLTYELQCKRQEDREEQRRVREQIRDEEQAEREIEKARVEAETEEARYQTALKKAQADVLKATGDQLQKLTDQIATFEAKLDEARKKKERAISRAQLTKSGFVYIISNIGSFGDGVFKIGMTRRMEPMDRVFELGGASVPFRFDTHVIIYSDNAPELETALHQQFDSKRVNLVNARREFFKDLQLEEIEAFVKARGLSAQFVKEAEAKEYRETLVMRNAAEIRKQPQFDTFAAPLFVTTAA
jgi:hypothetical protein